MARSITAGTSKLAKAVQAARPEIKVFGTKAEVEAGTAVVAPTPKQISFLQKCLDFRYLLYGGARGPGKSFILRWALIWRLVRWFTEDGLRDVRVGLFCEDYPTLKDRQISKIRKEFPDWLGTVKSTQEEGLGFYLRKEFGGGAILLRNLDEPSKYQCYHPDTEILTARGFVPVAEVRQGDLAATLDPETRQASYEPVTKSWQYDFDGELIETPEGKYHAAFSVTPNHSMLARTARGQLRFYDASDLPAECHVPRSARWDDGERPEFFNIAPAPLGRVKKLTRIPIVPWLRFLGWYISEGSLSSESRYQVGISQKKPATQALLREDLDALPYRYWVGQNGTFSLAGKALFRYLASLGRYSADRRIPRDILALHPDLLRHLFSTLMAGDGSVTATGSWVYVTTSPQLVDDVSELAIRLGHCPTVVPVRSEKGRYPNAQPAWRIQITERGDTRVRRARLVRTPYCGKVHCITVPPHHNVLIRFRNRVMWCGQSSEFAIIAVDELTKHHLEMFNILRGSLRWTGIEDTGFWGATNPGSIGHLWVKTLWLDQNYPPEMERIAHQFCYIKALPSDNEYLAESYWEELLSQPPDIQRAWIHGDWDVFEGQYFRQLSKDVHGFWPDDLPKGWKGWRGFRSYDWGFAKPASMGWWKADPDGNLYRYRELYRTGMEVEDFMELALSMQWDGEEDNMMSEEELIEYTSADPSLDDPSRGPSIAERSMLSGVILDEADNSRIPGWSLMRRYIDPATKPMIYVSLTCKDWWRTVPTLVYRDSGNVEDLDTDGEDHPADETRYFIMSRPEPTFVPAEQPSDKFEPGSASWHEARFQQDMRDRAKREKAQKLGRGKTGQMHPPAPATQENPEFGDQW